MSRALFLVRRPLFCISVTLPPPGHLPRRTGVYVRAIGNVRIFQDVIHIVSHDIRPVEDPNELTHHLLETIYLHCVNTKGPLQVLPPSLLLSPREKQHAQLMCPAFQCHPSHPPPTPFAPPLQLHSPPRPPVPGALRRRRMEAT